MNKLRIVKKTDIDGEELYVIQRKYFLIGWMDATTFNSTDFVDTFDSLEEAKENLSYFDGSITKKEEVVFEV